MRILYSFPHPIDGAGGINTVAFHQLQGIIEAGIEVILYCTSIHRELVGANRIVRTLAMSNLRIPHRVFGRRRVYRYHDRRVSRALRRLKGVDLVHGWPQASMQTFRTARQLGIKTIREVPNTHTAHAFEVVGDEMRKLGLAPIAGHSHTYVREVLEEEEQEYQLADCLVIPSEFSRRTFLDRGVPAEKLAVNHYGINTHRFFPRMNGSTAAASGPLRALFAARCEARKGLHYALDAWFASGVPERGGRLQICGELEPSYRALLGRRLEHPSIELRGFVPDLGTIMRDSDIFVYPAIEDGSALVTYMAQACGCVLVVSDAAGARCVHEMHGLIHQRGDVAALTAHIQRLDRDRSLLQRLRRAAIEASQELTWQRAAEQLVTLYQRVVADRASSGFNAVAVALTLTGC